MACSKAAMNRASRVSAVRAEQGLHALRPTGTLLQAAALALAHARQLVV
jgi:hypothetical protein